MEITKTTENDTTTLHIVGRVDTNTAPGLEKEVRAELAAPAVKIVMDLQEVDYVSSAGLRAFMVGNREARKAGKAIVLRGVRPEIMDVFKMTGFDKIFSIE